MKKTVKLLSIFAVFTLLFSTFMALTIKSNHLVAKAEGVRQEGNVYSWEDLRSKVKKSSKGDTLILANDIYTDEIDDRVIIDKKKNLTIELNGYSISKRANQDYEKNGHIFEIQGDSIVTIKDSYGGSALRDSSAKNGGAINIHEGSEATFINVLFQNNHAGVDGGAIYNSGFLKLINCVLKDNSARDTGGAIFNSGDGTFIIDGTDISYNHAANKGGGLNIHSDGTCEIINSDIHHNTVTYEGGGFYFDEENEVLRVTNTSIRYNKCEHGMEGYGGGFFVEDGKILIHSSVIEGNDADLGGAFYAEDRVEFTNEGGDSFIKNNHSTRQGGAIYISDGDVVLRKCYVDGNKSESSGGAIYMYDGECYIETTKIQNNQSLNEDGGAIYVYDGDLYLRGSEIKHNKARRVAGGVFCYPEMDHLYVANKNVILDNYASRGDNLYITSIDKVELENKLPEGTMISFTLVKGDDSSSFLNLYYGDMSIEDFNVSEKLTKNYSMYHGSENPNNYFASDEGFNIILKDGEVYPDSYREVYNPDVNPVKENTFIPWNEIIETDLNNINGSNWLSGISGERRINEINTPVTHDSSMVDVASATDCIGSRTGHFDDAVTQFLYIFEQLEAGIRGLDLRLSNKRVWDYDRGIGDQKDDGENLFMCHGKNNKGGTYFAKDPYTGYPLNFLTVLDWIESFLEENPTEYVIINMSAECQHDYDIPIVMNRLDSILRTHINDINETTGEPFFYLENGEYGKAYSDWPKLKDVRGKILIQTDRPEDYDIDDEYKAQLPIIGGISDVSFGGKYYNPKQRGSYSETYQDRYRHIVEFMNQECLFDLSSDASELIDEKVNKPIYIKIGTNCTGEEESLVGAPSDHPYILASRLNKLLLFGYENPICEEIAGKFIGWVSSDGVTKYTCQEVFMTNFFEGLEYRTLTVKSNKAGLDNQVFMLLKGTEITIPGYIYNFEQNSTNGYFVGWKTGNTVYEIGSKLTINEDITIEAEWSETEPGQVIDPQGITHNTDITALYPVNPVELSTTEIEFDINVYWINGDMNNLDIKLKEKASSNEIQSFYHTNFVDDNISTYQFKVTSSITAIDFDSYEVLINNETQGLNYNIFKNKAGYYVVVLNDAFTSDYTMVSHLIDSIGTVTKESEENIFWAEAMYSLLNDTSKSEVTNKETLDEAQDSINKIINANVISVITLINAIQNVQYNNVYKTAINNARTAYNNLSIMEQQKVVNYSYLLKVENAYKRLEKIALRDLKQLNETNTLIEEIGEIKATEECFSEIDSARSSYKLLKEGQRPDVTNYHKLLNSEALYFAEYFMLKVESVQANEVKTIWPELTQDWEELDPEVKKILSTETDNDSINNFNKKYSSIVNQNKNEIEPFENGPAVKATIPTWATILISISGILVLSTIIFSVVLIFKKKKRNSTISE